MAPATTELVDFLKEENLRDGYTTTPVAYSPPPSFVADVSDAISELPQAVNQLLQQKVAGIFVVRGLGSSGYSEFAFSSDGHFKTSFIVLDYDIINRRANDWLTWKESLPFSVNERFVVHAIIEKDGENNRKQAIQFLVLHELGHVLANRNSPSGSYVRYFSSDWESLQNASPSSFDPVFPERRRITYFTGQEKIEPGRISAVYANLRKTGFPTLYGSTAPREDYAETFAVFVHSVLLNKPYAIKLLSDGKETFVYDFALEASRLRGRLSLIESDLNEAIAP